MKIAIVLLALIVLALIVKWGIPFYQLVEVSKKLVQSTSPYRKEAGDYRKPMLVLGDSTAVGVGASSPEDSLAALVSARVGASNVENYAASGAYVEDLPQQIAQAKTSHYALILIQIGANNIVRFNGAASSARKLEAIIETLPSADQVVLISAGDVGGAPIWPSPLRPLYTGLNIAYHQAFGNMADAEGITYVNLYEDPSRQTITEHPEVYLAADGFHPSSEGYRLWFEAVQPALR